MAKEFLSDIALFRRAAEQTFNGKFRKQCSDSKTKIRFGFHYSLFEIIAF